MALQEEYIEALNNCIDRLASGESIDTILADYPAMANELRPMLEVGNLFSRVRVPVAEVTAAQSRLVPKIQAATQTGTGGMAAYWAVLGLVLLLGGISIFAWQSQSQEVSPTAIVELTAESSAEATVEAIIEATETPTTVIAIEGEVEAINANIITIYGMDIVLAEDEPLLSVIQIGDKLRIEGEYQETVFIAIIIIFVDADVEVEGGAVWRDSGDCNNPPPPWAPANGWRRRCEGGGGNGNGRGNGRGGSS